MSCKIILEQYKSYDEAKRPVGIPTSVKITTSKFDREVGEKMKFEGVTYMVMFSYPDSTTNQEVKEMYNYRVQLWKSKLKN